jgi:NADH-dependent peroxiredoxin subunit C
MITINSHVPDFEAEVYQNGEIKKVKLSKYKGKWVVLMFYPADFTYVCPTELEDMQSLYKDFKKLGAEVISVSTDTAFAHKAWHDTSPAISKVEYPMMADPMGMVSKMFGVYITEGGDAGLALRGTFIVDPDGVLQTIEIHNNDVGRSAAETLRKLQAAKFVREHPGGNVCPANWTPDKKALKKDLKLVGKI